jgi:hypothetical protein
MQFWQADNCFNKILVSGHLKWRECSTLKWHSHSYEYFSASIFCEIIVLLDFWQDSCQFNSVTQWAESWRNIDAAECGRGSMWSRLLVRQQWFIYNNNNNNNNNNRACQPRYTFEVWLCMSATKYSRSMIVHVSHNILLSMIMHVSHDILSKYDRACQPLYTLGVSLCMSATIYSWSMIVHVSHDILMQYDCACQTWYTLAAWLCMSATINSWSMIVHVSQDILSKYDCAC